MIEWSSKRDLYPCSGANALGDFCSKKGLNHRGESSTLINRSIESMRREVPTFLMNEKVTYIVFQGDLCVTLTLGFSYFKVAFGISFSQSDSWNFSSLLITINRKI
jgi:hypothetical protein